MFRTVYLVVVSFYLFVMGCKNQAENNLMAELAACDSATVMYYHKPGNPRFFNLAKVYDKTMVVTIARNVNGKLITASDSCLTLGKIYCYGKGDAVYVVYFNHEPDCLTMSFIKTGKKYYVRMNDDSGKILNDLKKLATEPVGDN